MMRKRIFFLIGMFIFFTGLRGWTQTDALLLDDCYRMAKENYPAIKKLQLIEKTTELNLNNAGKGYLPQVAFSGQATYQSQVISFSNALGGQSGSMPFPTLNKDQYKIQGEVDQLVYDGGKIRNQKEIIEADAQLQKQNIETSLYAIKQRINNLFFSVLLMDAQLKQNELNKASLQTQEQKAEAALKNGVAFKSSVDELKAEIVNIEMRSTEFKSNREAYLTMLSLFIGKELPSDIQLELPNVYALQGAINRPELKLLDQQSTLYDIQKKQLRSDYLPRVSAFFQGAYGRPTLNIIENKFGPWYITGLRFNWSLGSLYTLSNRKKILSINQQSVEADRATFLLNTHLDLSQQSEQVKKYTNLIAQDETAIALRVSVAKSAEAQLNNGVITTHEYIQKTNAAHLAKQTLILHQIQLLQAQYNLKFLSGN
ncbi:MAG: TolC family protein [Niabella sp.]